MKRIAPAGFAFVVLVLLKCSTCFPQRVKSSSEKEGSVYDEISLSRDSGTLRLNEINSNAARHFTINYRDARQARWFKSVNGLLIAFFTDENIQNWIAYSGSGDFEFMLRRYYQEKLPREVRRLVKKEYYEFNIFHVAEVTRNDKVAYIITLEDKRSKDEIFYKIIKVVDGEMEIVNEYSNKKTQEN